jgi:hypothetical protein
MDDTDAPNLEPLDSPSRPLSFDIEGPYDGPSDDYQPGGPAYSVRARRGAAGVGYVTITPLPNEFSEDDEPLLFINWIEVPVALRRQHIATALCAEAARRFPGLPLTTSGLTDLGQDFWPSLENRPDQDVNFDI